ncbi:Transmembrane protein [Gossypium australe]|uniref:Transmembrane protein n=1 Tax=Gossypium australe TaxID=47621 RepID=A0A5B6X1I4_9ROSI|nr:Transmembrane protein [Gossypium australe]
MTKMAKITPNYQSHPRHYTTIQTKGDILTRKLRKMSHLCLPTLAMAFHKEKVATALGKAKDNVSNTTHEANKLKQATSGTPRKAKEKVNDKAWETVQEVKEKVLETAHKTRDKVADTKGAIGDALGKAKGVIVQKGQDVKERAKESIGKSNEEMAMEEAVRAANKVKTSANKFLDALKYMTSIEALNTVMGIANLLGLAIAYGMSVRVTFMSSYILAGQLPRQQFGVVQSKIYPVYFRAMPYSIRFAFLAN